MKKIISVIQKNFCREICDDFLHNFCRDFEPWLELPVNKIPLKMFSKLRNFDFWVQFSKKCPKLFGHFLVTHCIWSLTIISTSIIPAFESRAYPHSIFFKLLKENLNILGLQIFTSQWAGMNQTFWTKLIWSFTKKE